MNTNHRSSEPISRRDMIGRSGLALAACAAFPSVSPAAPTGKKLGVSIASYGHRSRGGSELGLPSFRDALNILDHCHRHDAGGVQIGVRGWQSAFARKVRDRRESLGMFLEGQIGLPKKDGDVNRFESEIKAAKEAGATIIRTVMLGRRRYENFKTLADWREFKKSSYAALERAAKVVDRQRVKLAVENHKDWRAPELIGILRRIDSEYVGVTIDTGNSLSLLEDVMTTVETLVPYAFTTHFKDMGVAEYNDGFLLSEVPLGEGFVNLRRIIDVCEKANPKIQYNLEMITRDPLKVPCLTDPYWVTFGALPGRELARSLASVKRNQSKKPLPQVAGKNARQRVEFEEENIRKSFTFAQTRLGLK
mgnify:FL=1|jgi:sugar phosphate isomerase/epimerase